MLEVLILIAVSIFWGVTNPFLKQGGSGITKVFHNNKVIELALKLKYILFNWRCLAPLLINQFGSVLYFVTLPFIGRRVFEFVVLVFTDMYCYLTVVVCNVI